MFRTQTRKSHTLPTPTKENSFPFSNHQEFQKTSSFSKSSSAAKEPKLKRSSSIFGKFKRSKSTTKSNKINTNQFQLPEELPPSPTLSTNSQFSNNSNITTTSIDSTSNFSLNKVEKLPLPINWELRYDTILCQFYYVNIKDNIVQFDSPLEVIKY